MLETEHVRRQLTLFVPHGLAAAIEGVRRRVDPVQSGLIAAHVTLCREDELEALSMLELRRRLVRAASGPLTLVFGPPTPFESHGMLLPCIDGAEEFQALRRTILDTTAIRAPSAHLTLAHPRNPRAPENVGSAYAALPATITITFDAVALIEQRAAQPWVVRATLPLDAGDNPALPRMSAGA